MKRDFFIFTVFAIGESKGLYQYMYIAKIGSNP